jgi:hypothetical protein
VEVHVEVDDRPPRRVFLERVEALDRQLGVGDLGAGADDEPDRLDLERLAKPEDVDDVGGAEDGQLDAAVRRAPQQALVDEDLRRGAEGVPGDAEALREGARRPRRRLPIRCGGGSRDQAPRPARQRIRSPRRAHLAW